MIVERKDGSLRMYVRTDYGIGAADSFDGGKTFVNGRDSGLGGPDSRFFIGRLKSGRLLLVNHADYTRRDHLTALLSEDDGETWPYRLLLDERPKVSYPDAMEGPDGQIYVVYDRDRGYYKNSVEEMRASEREILMAKFREEDVIAGGKWVQTDREQIEDVRDGEDPERKKRHEKSNHCDESCGIGCACFLLRKKRKRGQQEKQRTL